MGADTTEQLDNFIGGAWCKQIQKRRLLDTSANSGFIFMAEHGIMTQRTLETTPDTSDARITPVASVGLLADLVDVLLPGDGSWPSGRTVGVQSLLALRLLEQRGKAEFARVAQIILAAGGPLSGLDEAARIAVVARFEANEPALFGWIRDVAYVTYYENPFVAEVINAQGHVYELRPHIKGYPVPRFDPERNTPRHGRGRYVPTEAVKHVDTAALNLASDGNQVWGLQR